MKFVHNFFSEINFQHHKIEIVKVITDQECEANKYAINNNIKSNIHSFIRNKTEDFKLIKLIEEDKPDLIICNINKILSHIIVKRFQGKLINLHYSLLPAFGGYIGMKPLDLAIQKGCKFVGATVHYVTDDLDMGPIISQGIFSIENKIKLKNKMYKTGCIVLINSIANKIKLNTCLSFSYDDILFSPNYELDKVYLDKIFSTL